MENNFESLQLKINNLVVATLNKWTALNLAIQHECAGKNSLELKEELIEEVQLMLDLQQYFLQNTGNQNTQPNP